MSRGLFFCGLLSFQILQCLSQDLEKMRKLFSGLDLIDEEIDQMLRKGDRDGDDLRSQVTLHPQILDLGLVFNRGDIPEIPQITCRATSIDGDGPIVRIEWIREGGSMPRKYTTQCRYENEYISESWSDCNTQDPKVSSSHYYSLNRTIKFDRILYDDAGRYICKVTSAAGAVTELVAEFIISDPRVMQFRQTLLEKVGSLNGTQWRYLLPDETDIDKDGNLSDFEIQSKFNTDIGKLFRVIDYDKDNTIVLQELESLKMGIPALTELVDVALENFPLRPLLIAADTNGDGFYDENDFYLPDEMSNETKWQFLQHEPQTNIKFINEEVWMGSDNVYKIGQNEGIVICKSLGFDGLKRLLIPFEYNRIKINTNVRSANCEGTETRIEDCPGIDGRDYSAWEAKTHMAAECRAPQKLGPLRLVGGKDPSSGEIFFGDSALTCRRQFDLAEISQVVCRQLGFAGVHKTTEHSDFTRTQVPKSMRLQKGLYCRGNEKNVSDCNLYEMHEMGYDAVCDHPWSVGVICKTDERPKLEQSLEEFLGWDGYFFESWELSGRFLFIADANEDGRVSVEEIATKGKKLLTKILEFLDQTRDGNISLRDFTSPRISISSIHDLMTELFAVITHGDPRAEVDLYNMKVAGQDMTKFWGNFLTSLEKNNDGKLTAEDMFWGSDLRDKSSFLLPILSQHLDNNQDGKIRHEELKEFTDEVFEQLDAKKDGFLTLEDTYSAMQKYGFDCLQVGLLRSFITVWLDKIESQTAKFFEYVFKQYDLDGNGAIIEEELQKIRLPCHFYTGNQDPDRMNCGDMLDTFFGAFWEPKAFWKGNLKFPDLEMFFRKPGDGRPEPNEIPKEIIREKMTNAACDVLTDYFN